MHGATARRKVLAGYGQQLREKQKVKRIYFVLEKQFRNYFEKASRQKGITGENLLFMLERRLDNVVYRAGFSTSRRQARQLVNHGHIEVNGRKVDIPSFQVKVGDVVTVKNKTIRNVHVEGAWNTSGGRGRPNWISSNAQDFSVSILALPKRDDVDANINEQLIVELYSK
jgi:small subunit ribosomal protein S4